jgi:hypothetical protein
MYLNPILVRRQTTGARAQRQSKNTAVITWQRGSRKVHGASPKKCNQLSRWNEEPITSGNLNCITPLTGRKVSANKLAGMSKIS